MGLTVYWKQFYKLLSNLLYWPSLKFVISFLHCITKSATAKALHVLARVYPCTVVLFTDNSQHSSHSSWGTQTIYISQIIWRSNAKICSIYNRLYPCHFCTWISELITCNRACNYSINYVLVNPLYDIHRIVCTAIFNYLAATWMGSMELLLNFNQ